MVYYLPEIILPTDTRIATTSKFVPLFVHLRSLMLGGFQVQAVLAQYQTSLRCYFPSAQIMNYSDMDHSYTLHIPWVSTFRLNLESSSQDPPSLLLTLFTQGKVTRPGHELLVIVRREESTCHSNFLSHLFRK